MVSDIPRIRGRITAVGHRDEVPVQVVGECIARKRRLLIVGVVTDRRQGGWEIAPGKRAVGFDAIPCGVIGVGQIAKCRRVVLVGEARQLAGCVVDIFDLVPIGIGETRSAIRIVVADCDRRGSLRDRCQPIGIVIGVRHPHLPGDGHARPTARVVIRIVDLALWRHFLRESVQPIIRSHDRRRDAFPRILFLYLRDSVSRIVRVVGRRTVMKSRFRFPIQRVIRVRCHLALSIRHGGHIAIVVVGIGLVIRQRIFTSRHTIHVVVRVDGLLRLGIRHREQIAVGIVGQPGHPGNGIGELRDAIEGIGGIDRLLPEGVNEAAEPSRRIEHSLCLAIQGVLHFNEITQLIGERRDVIERIFNRERLALAIDRDGRGLVEGVGDSGEIALGVIAERGRVAQGIRHRGNLIEIRLVGERRRDGIAGSLKLRDREHIALPVIGIGSLAAQSIGHAEEEIRSGLPLIGGGLRFGLTERINNSIGEALAVEGKPFHVSTRIGHIGLDYVAASIQRIGELIGRAVGLRLGRHPAITVIGVGDMGVAARLLGGEQPV